MQAPAGGAPGVRTQGKKGDDGSHTASPLPPPLQRDKCRASCLRLACDVLTPEDGQRGVPCVCTVLGDWCGGSAAYIEATWGR